MTQHQMKHGSFCTGYGGLDMAVEHFYNAETVWHSEIDADCNKLLEQHGYENNLGDLTKINWDDVEPVDIMSAGFPCQPFSIAGYRKGNDDERAIFQWIADGISVLRPSVVVLENVAGILTLGGTSVIGALASIGYDARWGVVRASDAGACHTRRRWFCIAHPNGAQSQGHGTSAVSVSQKNPKPASGTANVTDTAGGGLEANGSEYKLEETERETRRLGGFGPYDVAITRWEEILGRTAPVPVDERGINTSFVEWMMGLSENHVCNQGLSRTAELKMLGNGVVPQQALLALELLA